MSDSIKCISEVQFNKYTFFFPSDIGVDSLLNQDDVIGNMPSFDKATLVFRNDEREEFLESVGYNFGEDLIAYVA